MSRLIKVRAWDTKFEKMYYSHGDGDECQRVHLFHGDWEVDTMFPSGDDAETIPCDGKCAVLMQYTGLKDKNGKEIYEGDILQSISSGVIQKNYHIVIFEDGAFKSDLLNMKMILVHAMNNSQSLEVIGNIWEHPDLLK